MGIKVIIADDHVLLREALRQTLERETDIEVVAEANDGAEALRLAKEVAVDVVIMDISMPSIDGVNATRTLLAEQPSLSVLALSAHAEPHLVLDMVNAGALGYVMNAADIAEIVKAICAVHCGEHYLSNEAATAVADAVRSRTLAGRLAAGPWR